MTLISCLLDVDPNPRSDEAWRVFVPGLRRFPVAHRALMAMLPVVDVNGAAFAALATEGAARDLDAVALFLVDPFLNPREAGRRLARAGVRRIANLPSVQGYEGATSRALEAVGHGFREECAMLARLVAQGFAATGYAASPAAALALVDAGADRIVVAPGLEAGPQAVERLAVLIGEAVPGVPLARHVVAP